MWFEISWFTDWHAEARDRLVLPRAIKTRQTNIMNRRSCCHDNGRLLERAGKSVLITVYTLLFIQIVFVQTCSSEWSLKRIIRFSLLSTTGIPITESGHPTRVREEGGKARKTISSKSRESKRETEETLYCFLFLYSLPPSWISSLGRTDRQRETRETKKEGVVRWQSWECESEPVSATDSLCATCSVMLLRLWLPSPTGVIGFQEKECLR